MSNMKDKLTEIAKKAMENNAYSHEDDDGNTTTFVDDSEWDYTCKEIADNILEELSNITSGNDTIDKYKKRVAILEKALKRIINEYTYDGEFSIEGCEGCSNCGRPSEKCLENQFERMLLQAEKELVREAKLAELKEEIEESNNE